MTRDLSGFANEFREHGYAIVPGLVQPEDLAPGLNSIADIYPTSDEFHDNPGGEIAAPYRADEFAGIRPFPFSSVELNLLTVHPRLVELAEVLLGTNDIRIYSAELWAKYTGAADYEQELHRDYLNHTILVPTAEVARNQVEMFLYLHDVPEDLGPPHFVSRQLTRDAHAFPNWLSRDERPGWYEAEVSGAAPAGSVVAFAIDTFHRGTALTRPRGCRYTIQVGFRTAAAEWAGRIAWADHSHEPAWYEFVGRASLRQLLLFGFPPPGHPFWTRETLAEMALRYPKLDLAPFKS